MNKKKMYVRMILASLVRRRSRMIVALLAVMTGATILSGLVTIYYDVPRQMGAQFRSYGANMIITADDGQTGMDTIDEALSVVSENEIVGVAPYHYDTVRINERPVIAAATDMEGAQKTSPFWSVSGEWPEKSGEIMVGKGVASTYNLKTDDEIILTYTPEGAADDNEKTFTVTGILDTGGSEEEYVYLSTEDMSELVGTDIGVDICELSISADSEKLSAYADQINSKNIGISAKLVKRVTESETAVLGKLQGLVLIVTVVVLALTMICVATTMTAVVTERRQEIGLRKSLGAYDSDIVREFMGEELVLGAIGGLFGAVLGFVFAQVVSMNVFNSSISFRPALLPITIVASMIVTALACVIPIRSATRIDPAVVLKGE